jgi:hypothetical protein
VREASRFASSEVSEASPLASWRRTERPRFASAGATKDKGDPVCPIVKKQKEEKKKKKQSGTLRLLMCFVAFARNIFLFRRVFRTAGDGYGRAPNFDQAIG